MQRVLFVGRGDDIVLPLCCRIFESMCRQKGMPDVKPAHCGFFVYNSDVPHALTRRVAGELGLDLSNYKSRYIRERYTMAADWVIPIDEAVRRGLVEYMDRRTEKLMKPVGIEPPQNFTAEAFRAMRAEVMDYCEKLTRKFKAMQKAAQECEILPAVPADVDGLQALEQECFAHPWTRENLLAEWEKPNAAVIAAKNGKDILGYGLVEPIAGVGYIGNIAVTRKARGYGVATRILEALEAHCKSQNATEITLEVRVSNRPAIRLYHKLGYQQAGLRREFYRDPTEDALILTKTL